MVGNGDKADIECHMVDAVCLNCIHTTQAQIVGWRNGVVLLKY